MSTPFYDTDLTDAAWALVAQVLPAARPGGRPRTTNLRAVLNAIFYLLRTGCQWQLLPREFPPCGTVYHYFQAWQNSGVWVHLHRVLYEQARRHAGRAACPSVVIMDGQSDRMTAEHKRGLTPLVWGHVNPYGLFRLDMNTRLAIPD